MKRISAHAGIVNKRQTKTRMACMEGCHYFQASPTAGENRTPEYPKTCYFSLPSFIHRATLIDDGACGQSRSVQIQDCAFPDRNPSQIQ